MSDGKIDFSSYPYESLVSFAAYSAGYDDGFEAGRDFTDDGGEIVMLKMRISDLERRIEDLQRKLAAYSIVPQHSERW